MIDLLYIPLQTQLAPVDPGQNDWEVVGGDIATVSGQAYCAQKTFKGLMTTAGENPLYPGYGLPNLIGPANPELLEDLADGVRGVAAFLVAAETSTDPSQSLQTIVSMSATQSGEEIDYQPVFQTADGNLLQFPWPVPAGS
jgi:hypothetical protein